MTESATQPALPGGRRIARHMTWNIMGLCAPLVVALFSYPFIMRGLGEDRSGLLLLVWMLVGYFESIPRELEESAMIDGSSRFGAMLKIIVPLAAPGIAATAIFAFVSSWSELLFATTFTSSTEMRTLSSGLLYMAGQYEVQWGQLSAGVMISTVPVAILFTFLQKHLIKGLTAGAMKG
jgi:multiple sugar transport system permease protein